MASIDPKCRPHRAARNDNRVGRRAGDPAPSLNPVLDHDEYSPRRRRYDVESSSEDGPKQRGAIAVSFAVVFRKR
jgi:hypothetical protein